MPALIPPYADVGAWRALSVAGSARGQALDLVEHSRHHLRRVSQRGGPSAEFSSALMRATTSRADHSPFALTLACPSNYRIRTEARGVGKGCVSTFRSSVVPET